MVEQDEVFQEVTHDLVTQQGKIVGMGDLLLPMLIHILKGCLHLPLVIGVMLLMVHILEINGTILRWNPMLVILKHQQ